MHWYWISEPKHYSIWYQLQMSDTESIPVFVSLFYKINFHRVHLSEYEHIVPHLKAQNLQNSVLSFTTNRSSNIGVGGYKSWEPLVYVNATLRNDRNLSLVLVGCRSLLLQKRSPAAFILPTEMNGVASPIC